MASTCTDSFNFTQHKLFNSIKEFLPLEKDTTQNLLDCKDDILFFWNSKDCNILSLNWRAAKVKGFDKIKYQTLTPSAIQNFTVNKIEISNGAQFVALSGTRGISLLELPRRWGSNGQFQDGKENIICHSDNLDEHFFTNNTNLEIRQVRWHPGSPTDSHLLVLLSDNSIRVYHEFNLKHVWRVGPLPNITALEKNSSFLHSLGDTAVDFDFAPPRVTIDYPEINESLFNLSLMNSSTNISMSQTHRAEQKKVEWPILILRGDGSIFIIRCGLDTDKPALQGPITMFPSKLDNYGLDSCSIIVIQTLPPTVVIAENTGKIHHALLVETDDEEIDETKTIVFNEWDLHVLETIELELGLPEKKKNKKEISCPIHLKPDIVNEHRYFCYHNTGLHAVTLGYAQQLKQFVEENSNNDLSLSEKSRAEYILCTNAFETDKINAILGFTLMLSPSGLLLVLSSGQIISLDLIIDKTLIPTVDVKVEGKDNEEYAGNKLLKGSFDQHIKNLLKTDLSQPILKLDKSNPPTPQQAFELLINATQVLREKYFVKHEKVIREIENRIKILKILKKQQLEEIEQLQKDKEEIQDKATKLAEMHEDICEKQKSLYRRVQEVVRLATLRLPGGSASEKEFTQQIQKLNIATKMLAKNLDNVKIKVSAQEAQFDQWNKTSVESTKISSRQEKTIQEILSDMSSQIEGQVNDIKKINSCLNI